MEPFWKHLEQLMSSLETRPCAAWRPAADLYRCRDGWLIKFDLAGVRPEEIELEVADCRVTVRGTRRDWTMVEGGEAHQLEIAYSRFERTLELPTPLCGAQIRTEYRDGMFLVQIVTQASHD